jgi:hypothetical protein
VSAPAPAAPSQLSQRLARRLRGWPTLMDRTLPGRLHARLARGPGGARGLADAVAGRFETAAAATVPGSALPLAPLVVAGTRPATAGEVAPAATAFAAPSRSRPVTSEPALGRDRVQRVSEAPSQWALGVDRVQPGSEPQPAEPAGSDAEPGSQPREPAGEARFAGPAPEGGDRVAATAAADVTRAPSGEPHPPAGASGPATPADPPPDLVVVVADRPTPAGRAVELSFASSPAPSAQAGGAVAGGEGVQRTALASVTPALLARSADRVPPEFAASPAPSLQAGAPASSDGAGGWPAAPPRDPLGADAGADADAVRRDAGRSNAGLPVVVAKPRPSGIAVARSFAPSPMRRGSAHAAGAPAAGAPRAGFSATGAPPAGPSAAGASAAGSSATGAPPAGPSAAGASAAGSSATGAPPAGPSAAGAPAAGSSATGASPAGPSAAGALAVRGPVAGSAAAPGGGGEGGERASPDSSPSAGDPGHDTATGAGAPGALRATSRAARRRAAGAPTGPATASHPLPRDLAGSLARAVRRAFAPATPGLASQQGSWHPVVAATAAPSAARGQSRHVLAAPAAGGGSPRDAWPSARTEAGQPEASIGDPASPRASAGQADAPIGHLARDVSLPVVQPLTEQQRAGPGDATPSAARLPIAGVSRSLLRRARMALGRGAIVAGATTATGRAPAARVLLQRTPSAPRAPEPAPGVAPRPTSRAAVSAFHGVASPVARAAKSMAPRRFGPSGIPTLSVVPDEASAWLDTPSHTPTDQPHAAHTGALRALDRGRMPAVGDRHLRLVASASPADAAAPNDAAPPPSLRHDADELVLARPPASQLATHPAVEAGPAPPAPAAPPSSGAQARGPRAELLAEQVYGLIVQRLAHERARRGR